jgi:thiosulfate dehydrogenase [quinone] large subunit
MTSKDRGIFFLRVVLGFGFLFAGLDKFFMWASGAPFTAAGFLQHATGGAWLSQTGINPTKDFWVSLGQNAGAVSVINTLVVFGEIAIGVALILGLATRFAAVCGVLMMGLFLVAQMDFANGPFNEQLMYGVIAGTIAFVGAGAYALDSVVARQVAARNIPLVKYALG